MSYNCVILMGNLTRDVELRHTQGGVAIAEIGLAVSEKFKKGGQLQEETSFIDCTAFNRTAEIAAEYLSKGKPVLIQGRLKQERWETDGQKRSKVVVIVDKLQLIGGRGDSSNGNTGGQHSAPSHNAPEDEDIPF